VHSGTETETVYSWRISKSYWCMPWRRERCPVRHLGRGWICRRCPSVCLDDWTQTHRQTDRQTHRRTWRQRMYKRIPVLSVASIPKIFIRPSEKNWCSFLFVFEVLPKQNRLQCIQSVMLQHILLQFSRVLRWRFGLLGTIRYDTIDDLHRKTDRQAASLI